jgi:drug/metabolite transporter (DMT)-like permease
MLSVLLAVLAAATNAASSVLQRIANAREAQAQRGGVAGLLDLFRRPVWLAGVAAVILGFGLQAAALGIGRLSQVQPLMSLELPITLLLASRVFHHRLTSRDWAAIGAMAGGMSLFLFALDPTQGDPARAGALAWGIATSVIGVVVAVLALAAWRSRGNRRATLLGACSGMCFALTAAFMSATLAGGLSEAILVRWQTYLVPVAGVAAMIMLQEGMQAGTLVAVQPGVTLVDPVVAILLGILLFAERVHSGGWLALEIPAGIAIGWGAVTLARSPAAALRPDSTGEQAAAACGRRKGRPAPRSPLSGGD